MTANLRPMSLGEILDRTFHIYRSRFWLFFLIACIPVLFMESLQAADYFWFHVHSLVHPARQPAIFFWNFAVGLAYYHVTSIFAILVEPAIVKPTSNAIIGEESTIVSSLRFAAGRWRSYLWIAFLKLLANLLLPELVFAFLAIVTSLITYKMGVLTHENRWVVLAMALLVVSVGAGLFLWLGACLSPSIPAAALERIGGFRALRRSWTLSRGTRGRIAFTWLAVYLFGWVLVWGLEVLLGQLMSFTGSILHIADMMRHLYVPAVYVLVTAIYALLGPIYPIALTLFYYDQRIRNEGYDIERMMETAGLNPTEIAVLPDAAVPQATAEEELA
jgi:hypothetical protein